MKNLLTKIQNAESNEERDMLTYIFNKEVTRSLGKTLSEFGVDWSKLDVDGDRRYNCAMDAVVTQHLTSTSTMFMDLTHDLSKMRRKFKKQTDFGLEAIQQKHVNPNQKLANKIQTRPAMNWWTTLHEGKMVCIPKSGLTLILTRLLGETKYMIALETTSILQKSRSTFQTCGTNKLQPQVVCRALITRLSSWQNLSACLVMSRASG